MVNKVFLSESPAPVTFDVHEPDCSPGTLGPPLSLLRCFLEGDPCWDLVELTSLGRWHLQLGPSLQPKVPHGRSAWVPTPCFPPPSPPERAPEGCGRCLPPRVGWIPQVRLGPRRAEAPDQVLQRVVRPWPHADRRPGHYVDSGAKERYLPVPAVGSSSTRVTLGPERAWSGRRPHAASCWAVLPLVLAASVAVLASATEQAGEAASWR